MIEPTYTDPLVTLYLGDSLEVMRQLPDESVDSVVTDPPYGLSSVPDITEVLTHWLAGDDYKHRGGGFMGRSWDSFVPGPVYWRECFRVLKPGGHLLCFASTRTVDLMGIAVRLAGFEPRDLLMHVFASGFPKSLDVSKALDKVAGAEREVAVEGASGKCEPTVSAYQPGLNVNFQPRPITAPATDLARKWEGWGTSLKPAFEPIVMARKPLVGTVAANVVRYGTGALNIDGTRIPGTVPQVTQGVGTTNTFNGWKGQPGLRKEAAPSNPHEGGRWPSNVMLGDPELFDEPNPGVVGSGATADTRGPVVTGKAYALGEVAGYGGQLPEGSQLTGYGDTGGYSRFFRVPGQGEEADDQEGPRTPTARAMIDWALAAKRGPDLKTLLKWLRAALPNVEAEADQRNYPTAFIIPKADRAERERGLRPTSKLKLRADLTDEQRAFVESELRAAGVPT